jgi:hypothetical protein
MSDWSWKQVLASCVLDIVNRKRTPDFTLREVYEYTDHIKKFFPRNTKVKEKIRQVLQRLRDDEGFLLFSSKGHYILNLGFDEIDGEPVELGHRGIESPTTRRTYHNIRLRDTFLAREIKQRYNYICQVCCKPLSLSATEFYAEGHHLKPLGAPHYGPDVMGNIIVLCPNHHLLFDRAAATIIPDSFKLLHRIDGFFPRNAHLHLKSWHTLNNEYLEYHHDRFLEACHL